MFHRNSIRLAVLGAAGLAIAVGVSTLASAAPSHQGSATTSHRSSTVSASTVKPTIVLANGAWSSPDSWKSVIEILQASGYPVVAPPTKLHGLADDSAYLASYLKTIQGPVILVGQSIGGAVITGAATGDPNVKALVYITAFAPAAGETIQGLTGLNPGSQISDDPNAPIPTALTPVPYTLADGTTTGVDLYAKPDQYRNLFFSDRISSAQAAELAATQSPVAPQELGEKFTGTPAWQNLPSWYLVGDEDHLIPPATERFMAARAHAHTIEVDAPHAAQVTNPGTVANLIEQAACATG
ncbi:MAG TPA: alpha/beta hydrolase [Actinospica sp.]|nr:alpha/beta hydrolase [Actinospica sp.]